MSAASSACVGCWQGGRGSGGCGFWRDALVDGGELGFDSGAELPAGSDGNLAGRLGFLAVGHLGAFEPLDLLAQGRDLRRRLVRRPRRSAGAGAGLKKN